MLYLKLENYKSMDGIIKIIGKSTDKFLLIMAIADKKTSASILAGW